MKTGTEQIKRLILGALKKSNARLDGVKYGAFADALAGEIYALIGDEMSKRDWNMIHGVPDDLEKLIRRLERVLGGYTFKRDEKSLEVYRWVQEQPEEKLKAFIVWATDPERVKFIGKYRNNPGAIQFDWEQAKPKEPTFTKNSDGSLYV